MTSCLSKLLPYLTSLGISPRKALSQNFLIDPNIVEKVVEAAQIEPGDRVLEIGPGPGALTEVLLARGAQVIAVEYDPALARGLSRLQTDDRRLEIYLDDILRFPLEEKLPKEKVKPLIAPYRLEGIDSERPSGGHPSSPRFKNLGKEGCAPSDHPLPPPQDDRSQSGVKVVASLPYHISSPIMARLAPLYDRISQITVIVQREVALRYAAEAGTSDYSSISVFLKLFSEPRYLFTIPKGCFYPAPKVESAAIQFTLKRPPIEPWEPFVAFVRRAFNQKRKMLRASLKEEYPQIREALKAIGKPDTTRPQELSLEGYLALFSALLKQG